ncbi:MAG: T9SS type B sorting domain-containing protein, partial [Flavobacteriaceae bacterium]|nr:T9SS type B sorting domain-containing protein [Flavobacteriaceae bacterium]
GVTGTWSPATYEGAGTYTFTPDSDCGVETTITVTEAAEVQAEFASTTFEICAGEDFILPTPTNGVTGTWSPATYEGAGTYTFTPDSACGIPTEITVTEAAEVQAEFASTTFEICAGEDFILPTPTNGVTGTWSPATYEGAGTYTFTPDSDCGVETTITVTEAAEVQAEFASTTFEICEGDAFELPTPTNGVTGTWSPATYEGAGTYTFTPDSACGIPTEITITENAEVQAEFASTTFEICAGDDFILPTPTNGVTGTWSPATYEGAGTYTFTPDSACGIPTEITVTEAAEVQAEFASTTFEICAGETFSLPTPTNGVTGTWSPATYEGAGTYTFTPDSACGIPTEITVTEAAEVQAEFASTTFEICAGEDFTLPTPTNGVTGTWSPATYEGAGTYTFTPDSACGIPTEITITEAAEVQAEFASTTFEICAGEDFILPTPTNGVTGTWSPATYEGAGTYTFTPDSACGIPTEITVTEAAEVQAEFASTTFEICAGETFSLPTPTNGVTGTWSPATYEGARTYTFTPDSACGIPTEITITENAEVQAEFASTTFEICAGETFSLPTPTNGVTGTWSPATYEGAGTYTFTPDSACGIPTEITITEAAEVQAEFASTTFEICAGEDFILPTPTNGVTGTWSPATYEGAGTYTFTPDSACGIPTEITITEAAEVQAEFASTTFEICAGEDFILPTPTNGVTGTWSPATYEGAGTYTFTPDSACGIPTEITVTEAAEVQAEFASTTFEICAGEDFILPTPTNGVTGTWSPATYEGAGTYTFTPDSACGIPTEITVTEAAEVQAEFASTTFEICTGEDFILPTPTNGVTGTWSPATYEGAGTYTFTPDSACGVETTITVTEAAEVQAEFASTTFEICAGEDFILPTPTNGVSGTWSPATYEGAGTYTFTPDSACGIPTEITITENAEVQAEFASTTFEICAGEDFILPTPTNGVTGTWSPATYEGAGTYTFTPDSACGIPTEITVTEAAEVQAEFASTTFEICTGEDFILPTPTNGVTGTWSPATYEGAGTYTFTPDSACGVETTITVTEAAEVQAEFASTTFEICAGEDFILPTPTNGVSGTWSPATYEGAGTYTFTPDSACGVETTITVTEAAEVQAEFASTTFEICAGEDFILPTPTNGVTGTWSPATYEGAGTYTFTPDSACGIPTEITVTEAAEVQAEFASTTFEICAGEDFILPTPTNGVTGTWSPATYEGAGTYTFTPDSACGIPTEITVTEAAEVQAEFASTTFEICAGETFSLPTPTNGVTGTWSPATYEGAGTYTFTPDSACGIPTEITVTEAAEVQAEFASTTFEICAGETFSLPTPTNGVTGTWSPATYEGAGTYTFTPDSACGIPTEITITENAEVQAEFASTTFEICAGETFSLPTPTNGVTGTWSPATYEGAGTYTFTPDSACGVETTITVTEAAEVQAEFASTTFEICAGEDFILPTPTNGVTGTWSPATYEGAGTYTFTPDSACGVETTITVTEAAEVQAEFASSTFEICQGDDFILPTPTNGVSGTWSPATYEGAGTYTFTPDSACGIPTEITITEAAEVQAEFAFTTFEICAGDDFILPTPTNGVTGTWSPATYEGAGTYTFTPDSACGVDTTISVSETAEVRAIFTQNIYELCVDEIFTLPMPTNGVAGTWSPASYQGPGTYSFTPDSACGVSTSIIVRIVERVPEFSFDTVVCIDDLVSLPSTSDNGIVGRWVPGIVNTGFVGIRIYTFIPNSGQCAQSLDVTIEVTDCDVEEISLFIPNVITPNGDGLNDVWKIEGIENYPNATLQIYNRFNKLLYDGKGAENCIWDGFYLGRPLPSTDYWYILNLGNGVVKKGHITVKNPRQ